MKTILITGVSKGLGLQLIKSSLKEGNKIYGLSRTSNNELEEIKEEYRGSFIHLNYDMGLSQSITKISRFLLTNKISLDGFVNNAAIAYDDLITNANLNDLELMFKVNVINPIMLTKSVIRNFLLYKVQGSIVHISSISAHTGYKGLSMYASTKGALEAFSKNTAREWGEIGIRSNCVVAGFMETNMSQKLTDEQKKRIYNRTSLKMSTDIDSVTSTINFMLSNNSKSITGQNIFVDSGTI